MEKRHIRTRSQPQLWNAPGKEQKHIDIWERIRTETRAMQQNEINRNLPTPEKRSLHVI